MNNSLKVFNSFRLGAFVFIVLFVGWNDYSSSIHENESSNTRSELKKSKDSALMRTETDTAKAKTHTIPQ